MKVMVLGGGSNQIDLIKKAKQEGDEVILIDYLTDCPGKDYADIHLLVSTFDSKSVLKAAKKLDVDAIVTSGTDQPVLSAAIASEELGLNCYADKSLALAVTNKTVMKSLFSQHNIPTVAYRLIKEDFVDLEIAGLNFPVVLKPVDCQGQRGVYKLNNIEEVRGKIASTLSYSRETHSIIEEFYDNDEITINGWVDNGKLTIISVVDRVTIKKDNHIGICLCHNFPSVYLDEYYDEIKSITEKIITVFNIKNGPIYFQYMIGNEGIKVNEIAMRVGGAYEGVTIPMIAGIDILKMVLDFTKYNNIKSHNIENYSLTQNHVFLSTQLFFCNAGTINYMTPAEEIESIPCVKAFHYGYKQGDTIKRLVNATARAGYIIIEGSDFNDMIQNVNYVFDRLKILNKSGENLVIKYNDYNDKYLFKNI